MNWSEKRKLEQYPTNPGAIPACKLYLINSNPFVHALTYVFTNSSSLVSPRVTTYAIPE